MLAIVLVLAAAVSTSARAPDEAALARAVGDRVPGKPVDCIDVSPSSTTSTEIVDGTAIIYRVNGRVYVNRPRAGASALRRNDILVTHIYTGQLCRIDSVTLTDATSPIPHGVVLLGDFVPYERAPRRP